jgi:hypothetical protein
MILLVCLVTCAAAPGAMGRNHLEIFGAEEPVQKNLLRTMDTGVFNLSIEEFTAPPSARQGQDVSGSLAFSFRNEGPDDISEAFMARIFLTDDVEGDLEVGDYLFWTTVPGLAAGEAWVFESGAVVPFHAPVGATHLVAEVDLYDSLPETDENDNRVVLDFSVEESQRTLIYYEDFQDGDGGWQPRDLTEQEIHLQHTFYAVPDQESAYGVWWCGDDDPLWGTPPGYGSSWEQRLTKGFDLTAEEPLAISYAIQFDTAENDDVIHVEVSDNNGGSFDLLAVHSGSSDGEFLVFEQDLTAYAGREVLLRFRFKSDGSWDDEAGNLDTDGAYRLDYVEVSGHGRDDFEEDGGGWIPTAADPVGGQFLLLAIPV